MEKKDYGTFSIKKSALKIETKNKGVVINIENEKFPNIIEEMIIRFPQLLQHILRCLDMKSLVKCLKISKELYSFIDHDRYCDDICGHSW